MEPKPPPPVRLRARLREGARPAFAVFATIFAASAVFTFTCPKVYEATAVCHFPRDINNMISTSRFSDDQPVSEYQRLLDFTRGDQLVQRVAAAFSTEESQQMLSPHPDGPQNLRQALTDGLTIRPLRLSNVLVISFRHSDPVVASRLANAFADETLQWGIQLRGDEYRKKIEDFVARHESQKREVERLNAQMAKFYATLRTSNIHEKPVSHPPADFTEALARAKDDLAGLERHVRNMKQRSSDETKLIRKIDTATPPAPGDYISPDHRLHLGLGAFLGLIAAFLTARLRSPRLVA